MNPETNSPKEKREDHDLISPTAKLVAHLRADTDIPYSKEIDEICEAGKTTEELFGKKETLGWMSAMLELRYKSLSRLLEKEMAERGITQVLELACGIQPRGLIATSSPEITYVESDLPEMAQEKRNLVSELDPKALERDNYRIESLNILDQSDVERVIIAFDSGPIAIINEGLLPYLSVEEKGIVTSNIHRVLTTKGGVWITPDISNSSRMREIIQLFPGSEEAVKQISHVTGRDLRSNNIGDKETTLKFYSDAGFNISEYTQKSFVPNLNSLDAINDPSIRESVDSALDESNIWVLEVK